ncbi:MAG: penicillin acylase family protein [Ignavibacteria bacterium]|nr:penicillin acylase family protein [Ignavibacteria bacterium]
MSKQLKLLLSFILSGFILLSFLNENSNCQSVNSTQTPLILKANDGSIVTIYRDDFGVPHIVGNTESGMFYGQGFAAAQDRLFQMEINRRFAEGKVSDIAGEEYLLLDQQVRREFYTEAERIALFNALQPSYQEMIIAYTAGVNAYRDSMFVNPAAYKPFEFLNFDMVEWKTTNTIAIIQSYIRGFGKFGGDELTRLLELQVNGEMRFNIKRPINDRDAPTTIPEQSILYYETEDYKYSGMHVRHSVVEEINSKKNRVVELEKSLGIPEKFGSFAVLFSGSRSSNGNTMLLGCPQMGEPEQNSANVVHEVELQCPVFHVGGMTIAGMPMVIIGRNEYHAWTMTSGASDNCDLYIDSTMNTEYSSYYHNDGWLEFETIIDTIYVLGIPTLYTHYRTIHGPVLGGDLSNHQVFSLKMTFWKKELDMIEAFYVISIADNLQTFKDGVSMIPVSFNVFYAGKDQNIGFWHAGIYQNRTDGVDPRLPHKGDGSEEWNGFIPFIDLPNSENPPQGYFVNWNNKPVSWWNNGDNMAWIYSSYVYNRVNKIYNYVYSLSSFSFDDLMSVPCKINSHGSYQQVIELSAETSNQKNIIPPGQSAFINMEGHPSPHTLDQWNLHLNWEFKDMIFEQLTPDMEAEECQLTVLKFELRQNYPNPFNAETNIRFNLPRSTNVKMTIFNIVGMEVKTLMNGYLQEGTHNIHCNLSDLSSGVYFYKIEAPEFSQVKKMVLLK